MPLPTPGQPRKTQWTFLRLRNIEGLLLLELSFHKGEEWRVVWEVKLREMVLMVVGIRDEFDNLRRRLVTAMVEQ